MTEVDRIRYLRIALTLVGLIFIFGIWPLSQLWPSGWSWHAEGRSHYLEMILGIYATLGVFLIIASREPMAHASLIWFGAAVRRRRAGRADASPQGFRAQRRMTRASATSTSAAPASMLEVTVSPRNSQPQRMPSAGTVRPTVRVRVGPMSRTSVKKGT
jgi:hypothetical protein